METTSVHEDEATENSSQPEPAAELDSIPDFVQPLFDFVNANGDEVREWPWMNGAKASLRSSVYKHPRAQTYLKPEDIPVLMGEIQQGLAKKGEDDSEDEEEEKPEEETEAENIEEEEPEVEESQAEIEAPELPPAEASASEALASSGEVTLPKSEPEIIENPEPVKTKAEKIAKLESIIEEAAEPEAVIERQITAEIDNQIEPVQVYMQAEIEYSIPKEVPVAQIETQAEVEIVEAQVAEEIDGTPEELVIEAEQEEIEITEIEAVENTAGAAKLIEEAEGTELAAESENAEIETEESLEHMAEADLEARLELEEAETENAQLVEAELAGESELLVLSEIDFKQTQDFLLELQERLNEAEPGVLETAEEILDEIMEIAQLLAKTETGQITEQEAEGQLTELFTELLDTLHMEYTPELVESLVLLVLHGDLAAELEKSEQEDEPTTANDGTHEVIKKLLVVLGKAKIQAYAQKIGQFVIRQYNLGYTEQPAWKSALNFSQLSHTFN